MIFLRGEGEDDGQVLHAILAQADGTVIRDLGPVSHWFDFSPDDSLLAVCCDGGTIATMTLEGVRTPLDLGGLEPMSIVNWRPTEGKELIFLAHPDTETAAVGLYAIAPDGSGLRQIGELDTDDTVRSDQLVAFSGLQLSPDGSTAAYWNWEPDTSDDGMGPFLHLLDLDTGEQLPVPFAPADGHGVTSQFSPDGEWVVYDGDSLAVPGRSALLYGPVDGSVPMREIGPAYRLHLPGRVLLPARRHQGPAGAQAGRHPPERPHRRGDRRVDRAGGHRRPGQDLAATRALTEHTRERPSAAAAEGPRACWPRREDGRHRDTATRHRA